MLKFFKNKDGKSGDDNMLGWIGCQCINVRLALNLMKIQIQNLSV